MTTSGRKYLTAAPDKDVEQAPEQAPEHIPGDLISKGALTLRQLLELPPPEWLLEDILVEDSLAILFGKPKSGKSFLALDWALCVAYGLPWQRHEVRQRAAGSRVLYVAGEGHRGLTLRAQAWMKNTWTAREHEPDQAPPFTLYPRPLNLLNIEHRDELVAWAEREQPDLVIYDTLARSMAGGDENSARDIGQVVEAADLVRAASGSAGVALHHTDKRGDDYRGSSALHGAADTLIRVTKEDKPTGARITVECEDQKDAPAFDSITLALDSIDLGHDAKGRRLTSCVLRQLAALELAADLVASDANIVDVLRDVFPDTPASYTELTGMLNVPAWSVTPPPGAMNRQQFHRALGRLVDHGHVIKVTSGAKSGSVRYRLPEVGGRTADQE